MRWRRISSNGQVVFLPPGTFGSFAMSRIVRAAGSRADVAWAETGTLPYLARKHGERERSRSPCARCACPPACTRRRQSERALAVIRAGLSERARLRRCAVGRADECRADHPSAADGDERRAAAALRALGHPQRRHAAGGARGHRPARPGAHRGARGARLRRAALSAGRSLPQRPLDVRRCAQATREVGRLARAHRPAPPPLRHRRLRAGLGLSRVGGALGAASTHRSRKACWRSSAEFSGATCGAGRARSKRWASRRWTAPGCSGCCTREKRDGALCRGRRRPHGARHRDRVCLRGPSHRVDRPEAAHAAGLAGAARRGARRDPRRACRAWPCWVHSMRSSVDSIAERVQLVDAERRG